MKSISSISALLMFLLPGSGYAANDAIALCQAKKLRAADYLRCLDEQLNLKQRETDVWVNNKKFQLEEFSKATGHKGPITIFKRSNKHFKNYMDAHCLWQYQLVLPDTTSAAMKMKECKIQLLDQRLEEMKNIGKSLE